MKNTELTTREDRTERVRFALIMLAFPVIMVVISMLISGCATTKDNDPLSRAGTQDQKERFLECSKNEGDQGCDSCYFLVYGKHTNF